MFEKYKRTVEETRDLDLIPVMNLFMVLIPFLLMGAAFYHIGVIPSSLPTHTPNQSDVPKTPTKVTINLTVTPQALVIGASSTSLNEEQLAELAGEWKKNNNEYSVDAVQDHLKKIKERYPKSDTLIVLPHEELGYQTLVQILDKTREYRVKSQTGEDKAYELFPVVVFSRFIKEAPEQQEEQQEQQEQES